MHSGEGPYFVEDSQIARKTFFLVRFLELNNYYTRTDISNQRTVSSKKIQLTTTQSLSNIPKNIPSSSATYPESLSVAGFLHAGRIARPKEEIETLLVLELFNMYEK